MTIRPDAHEALFKLRHSRTSMHVNMIHTQNMLRCHSWPLTQLHEVLPENLHNQKGAYRTVRVKSLRRRDGSLRSGLGVIRNRVDELYKVPFGKVLIRMIMSLVEDWLSVPYLLTYNPICFLSSQFKLNQIKSNHHRSSLSSPSLVAAVIVWMSDAYALLPCVLLTWSLRNKWYGRVTSSLHWALEPPRLMFGLVATSPWQNVVRILNMTTDLQWYDYKNQYLFLFDDFACL